MRVLRLKCDGEMISKYQKFTVSRVWRSEIKLAHYNPRKISEESKKRLKKNIKSEAGLIETPVVNKLTMNLVSGHQRLNIMDELEKYPKKDYQLDVAFVEMTEEQEKKQNVFMNSKNAQGEFDNEMLAELMQGYEAEDFGLSELDAALMEPQEENQKYDDKYFKTLFEKKTGTKEQKADNKQHVKDMKAQINERAGQKAADSALSYCVLNFANYKDKQAFMQRFDLDPVNTFIDGNQFSEMVERIYE